ncbi:rhomboid family intramembrane serine protease [Methanococcus maripaludis]|nr:rhomboid family intramembrane serine protease [Methanococcus maripaludis]
MDHLKYNMLYLIIFGYIVEYKLNLKTYLFLLMSIWLIPLISFTAYWIINEKPINYSGIGISGVVYGFMYISYYFMGNFVFNKTKFSKSNGFWSSFMFALFFSVLTFLIDFSVSNCGGGMVHFSGIAVSAFFCYHNYYKKEIIV